MTYDPLTAKNSVIFLPLRNRQYEKRPPVPAGQVLYHGNMQPSSWQEGDLWASPTTMYRNITGSPTAIGAPAPDATANAAKLSWAPPELVNPITVTLTNASRKALLGDATRDYIVTSSEVIDQQVEISGSYRNVIVKNIEVNQITDRSVYDTTTGVIKDGKPNRGLFIKGTPNNTTPHIIHIEGVKLTGPKLREGVNWDGQSDTGLRLRFQNCIWNDHADGLRGAPDGHHADAMQVFNAGGVLEMDRISILTNYQAFMIQPPTPPEPYVYRRIEVRTGTESGTLFYQGVGAVRNIIDRVYCTPHSTKAFPDAVLDLDPADWAGVVNGPMPLEHKVNGNPGLSYVSPGYVTT